jgi:hypothetical protein
LWILNKQVALSEITKANKENDFKIK